MQLLPSETNAFLNALSPAVLTGLGSQLMPLRMRPGAELFHRGDAPENVIFPLSGLIVMTVPSVNGSGGSGVTLIGNDAAVGGFVSAAGVPATCDATVVIGGQAVRLPATIFRQLLETDHTVRGLAAKFNAAMLAQ